MGSKKYIDLNTYTLNDDDAENRNIGMQGNNASNCQNVKRPTRPKLLKLDDVTIPQRRRKKSKTKTKDRSQSSVRDRIYDDPGYTDDISHLVNPFRRGSFSNIATDERFSAGGGGGGGSNSLGQRSKLTKEFLKIAQEDMGRIVFSSSDDDLQIMAVRSGNRGRSLERKIKNQHFSDYKKQKNGFEGDDRKVNKSNFGADKKYREMQFDKQMPETSTASEVPAKWGKKYRNEASAASASGWFRKNDTSSDKFFVRNTKARSSLSAEHESSETMLSPANSTANTNISKLQMGRRFLKGEIGIKSFNYYLLKEGLKSSKKFIDKQRNGTPTMQSSTLGNEMNKTNDKQHALAAHEDSEENIYEEIFFDDTVDEQKSANFCHRQQQEQQQHHHTESLGSSVNRNSNEMTKDSIVYPDCELCMQQCDKPDCDFCYNPVSSAVKTETNVQTSSAFYNDSNSNIKANNVCDWNAPTKHLVDNDGATTANDVKVSSAPILEFQSYNPNNPGVYKMETTPVAITGDYNPILQFQQQQQPPANMQSYYMQQQQQQQQQRLSYSTSNPSTTTTTPSEQQFHMQQQQQQEQQILDNATTLWLQSRSRNIYQVTQNPVTANHTETSSTRNSSLQHYQKQQQQQQQKDHEQQKLNILSYLKANYCNENAMKNGSNAATNSYLYNQSLHPLMCNATRRLGGSQIHLDANIPYEAYSPGAIYKTDSRTSILSEYSLSRSSDTYYGSQRYGKFGIGGGPHNYMQRSEQQFGSSLLSTIASNQRRHFGSAENCHYGSDCRRCSFDNIATLPSANGTTLTDYNAVATGADKIATNNKCPYTGNCNFDCRYCDCSSNYFSSDFDELYSGKRIPRKTAKGTLPCTGGQPPPSMDDVYNDAIRSKTNEHKQALKQNKYAQDFFKHVNDVKRSIYQDEIKKSENTVEDKSSEKEKTIFNEGDDPIAVSTVPLAKERIYRPIPIPAPRISLQQAGKVQAVGDKGAVPKISPRTNQKSASPQASERNVENASNDNQERGHLGMEPTRHKRPNNTILSSFASKKNSSIFKSSSLLSNALKRRDIPAPPPPSPELQSEQHEVPETSQQQEDATNENAETSSTKVYGEIKAQHENLLKGHTIGKEVFTQSETMPNKNTKKTTPSSLSQQKLTEHIITVGAAKKKAAEPFKQMQVNGKEEIALIHGEDKQTIAVQYEQRQFGSNEANDSNEDHSMTTATSSAKIVNTLTTNEIRAGGGGSVSYASVSLSSSLAVTITDSLQRDLNEDDDVFYDARSEDSGCNATSCSTDAITARTRQKQQQPQQSSPTIQIYSNVEETKQQNVTKNDSSHKQNVLEIFTDELKSQECDSERPFKDDLNKIACSGNEVKCCHDENVNEKQLELQNTTTTIALLKVDNGYGEVKTEKDLQHEENEKAQKVNNNIAKNLESVSNSGGGGNVVKRETREEKREEKKAKHSSGSSSSSHKREQQEKEMKTKLTMNPDGLKSTPTTTTITPPTVKHFSITSSATARKQRTQRRSHTVCMGRSATSASTLSCDTCCREECKQQQLQQYQGGEHHQHHQHQQQSLHLLKPPTLHVGMSGQPTRVSKRKMLNNKERANKTKHEIKTKVIYSNEKGENVWCSGGSNIKETGFTIKTITTTTTASTPTKSKEMIGEELCAQSTKTVNVAEKLVKGKTKIGYRKYVAVDKSDKWEQQQQQQQHVNKKNKASTPTQQKDVNVENVQNEKLTATTTTNTTTITTGTVINDEQQLCDSNLMESATAGTLSQSSLNRTNEESTQLTASIELLNNSTVDVNKKCDEEINDNDNGNGNENGSSSSNNHNNNDNDQNNVAETTNDETNNKAIIIMTTTTTIPSAATATAAVAAHSENNNNNNDDTAQCITIMANTTSLMSEANSTAFSCNTEFAGVTTHTPNRSTVTTPLKPPLTTLNTSTSLESERKRPPLLRQDYSCPDSSEAQSDDSHLTRDSITRDSQNDELSSSTLDKIDITSLPLPALPPKKRRTKLRTIPSSKHHQIRHHDDDDTATTILSRELNDREHLDLVQAQPNSTNNNNNNQELLTLKQYVDKRRESIEASTRSFTKKLEAHKMHYHMRNNGGEYGGKGGSNGFVGKATIQSNANGLSVPTYLFGEHYCPMTTNTAESRKFAALSSQEEIYLNKSGWVQVNTKRANEENQNYRRTSYHYQNGNMRNNAIHMIKPPNNRCCDITSRQRSLQHQRSIVEMPKFTVSRVEELLQRNDVCLGNCNMQDQYKNTGFRVIDSAKSSNFLNERPHLLPVRLHNDNDSPPPVTPILSPPLAFQDNGTRTAKQYDQNRSTPKRVRSTITTQRTLKAAPEVMNGLGVGVGSGKGMVFSRSFEYETRRHTPNDAYVNTFSRSFDGNLSERPTPVPLLPKRDRFSNFSTLTGNSPSYLTKKDSGGGSSGSLRSRDSSPKYQSPVPSASPAQSPQNIKTTAYLNTSVKEAPASYMVSPATGSINSNSCTYSPRARRNFERSKSHNVVLDNSRKSQFSRLGGRYSSTVQTNNNMRMSRFRSMETTIAQRLNSCDSGARSDLSNDELEIENEDVGSTEFLNILSSPFKTQRQRSLTPERNESYSSSSSLRKQRSLTPESRSLTPEDRRKRGSQASLMGSRNSTLERKHEKYNISRSSSSSSYSGSRDFHDGQNLASNVYLSNHHQQRRLMSRNAKQTEEYRIRRSRSLQLTERSPNRGPKMATCMGQTQFASSGLAPPIHQQANNRRVNLVNQLPSPMRKMGKSQSILLTTTNGSTTRLRQNDIDKSHSFDFDYCNYESPNNTIRSHHSNSSVIGSVGGALNRDAKLSHSFEENFRDQLSSNNNLNVAAMRYLQTIEGNGRSQGRSMRRCSPVEGSHNRNRSPHSSGSSCNNLNVPRPNTSPQNYGTRLCDHELTYDLMRKSLDRSPIMDFRRGDNNLGQDYDLPLTALRNHEIINKSDGGGSDLNYLNSEKRLCDHLSTTSLKKRSLRRMHSPKEAYYSTDQQSHGLRSPRDEAKTLEASTTYRTDHMCGHQRDASRNNNRGSHITQTLAITTDAVRLATNQFYSVSKADCCPRQTFKRTTTTTLTSQQQHKQQQQQLITTNDCDYIKTLPGEEEVDLIQKLEIYKQPKRTESKTTNGTQINDHPVLSVKKRVSMINLSGSDRSMLPLQRSSSNSFNTTRWSVLCSGATSMSSTSIIQNKAATKTETSSSLQNSISISTPISSPLVSFSYLSLSSLSILDSMKTNDYSNRVIPLTATSLVYLSNYEQTHSVNPDLNDIHPINSETFTKEMVSFKNNKTLSILSVNVEDEENETCLDVTTKLKKRFSKSFSWPDITVLYPKSLPRTATATSTSTPTLTNANAIDDISFTEMHTGISKNLTQQLRAISTPSLIGTGSEVTQRCVTTNNTNNSFITSPAEHNNRLGNRRSNSIPSAKISSSSQSRGVLQKVKRTFTNFHKSQSSPVESSLSFSSSSTPSSNATTATKMIIERSKISSSDFQMKEAADMNERNIELLSKSRFEPLIWRSSKGRRRTKCHRQNKCNSGDSGIQIEAESDDPCMRYTPATIGDTNIMKNVPTTGLLTQQQTEKEDFVNIHSLKLRAVRRYNSLRIPSTAYDAKDILNTKQMIPKSMPFKSISEPNGLEFCGINASDFLHACNSDSNSINSHDGVSNYYKPVYGKVLYNFMAAGPQELSLTRGCVVEILRKETGPWWFGRIKKKKTISLVGNILNTGLGWFPRDFIRLINTPDIEVEPNVNQNNLQQQQQLREYHKSDSTNTSLSTTPACEESEVEHQINQAENVTTIVIETSTPNTTNDINKTLNSYVNNIATTTTTIINVGEKNCYINNDGVTSSNLQQLMTDNFNVIMYGSDILKHSAIKELLHTEINYVKHLASICEGYLPAMNKRVDIFSPNSIRLIFSNITAIYKFQRKFLEALRKGIEQKQLAQVFLKMHKSFLCYSIYCNSYPRALIELESYEKVKDARTIFNNCLESEHLVELPLSAHLLAPIQRICRYPLHLAEIIKTTCPLEPEQSPDQRDVNDELDLSDNHKTLHLALEAMKSVTEAVNEGKRHSETIIRYQASFQNFKGSPLHLHSTRFFLQIDATRQKQNLWNSSCTLFLFDNQLIYCKRDILKRSQFIYKGRIFLDHCRVVNVRDGKIFGHTIKNSFRIYCEARDKWFDFSFRSANRKQRFLNTLALERQFSGKTLFVAEMTGFQYVYREGDISDQSDYEAFDHEPPSTGSNISRNVQKNSFYSIQNSRSATNIDDSSISDSTNKLNTLSGEKFSDSANSQNQTSSLGRRRLGNWFRKSKSSTSTPNQSPTHKPQATIAHSTGDLPLASTELVDTYMCLEDKGGVTT